MSDTRSDYRLIVADHAASLLEHIVRTKKLPVPTNWQKATELAKEAHSLVKRMRFSFIPPTMLARSEEAKQLQEVVKQLTGMLLNPQWADRLRSDRKARRPLAETRYALRTLYGLPARLALGDDNDPFYAFDIECVTVTSVSPHPEADNLYVTTAKGKLAYTIVTNIRDVRRGELRAAAILPPREFRGVVSEAMYCSRRPLREEEGCTPGKRPPRQSVELGEIGAILAEIARQVH